MNATENRRSNALLCLWCLPIGLVIFTGGWILSGYFPPPSPAMSPEGFQEFFMDNADRIRIAITPLAVGGLLTVPFAVAVTTTMLRFEGPRGPLAYTQLVMGALSGIAFCIPLFPLMAAAFRPDSDPEILRMLHDFFWLPYIMAFWSYGGQMLCVAALAFRDDNPLPRWYAYLCVWCTLGMTPSALILFFQTGAFSPRGIFGLWLVGVSGYAWYVTTFIVFRRLNLGLPDGRDRP